MTALVSSYGVGQYATGEAHLCVTSRLWKGGGQRRGCILFHGRNGSALNGAGAASEPFVDYGMPVLTTDCGGATHWGNDASIARTGDSVAYIKSQFGAAADQVVLCAISMGTLPALLWTLENPGEVSAIVLITPVIDLADVHDNNLSGWQSEIRTAYGGQAAYEAAISTHNPALSAEDFTGMPIRIYYSTNDPIARPTPVLDFAAASDTEAVSIGATGHVPDLDVADAAAFLNGYA